MLTVDHLVKSYRDRGASSGTNEAARVFAVDDVSFEVKAGELFTLLGPSGCGKSTTLRSIAGLEQPDSGEIAVEGRTVFSAPERGRRVSVPAAERQLGMVFQSYAIWPHMSVFDNVAFPLRVRPRSQRPSRKAMTESVMKVLETMELASVARRNATQLSGGQQQRLALARAVVMEPAVLLLDEPLSNLDAKLRESLRFELKRMQRELNITTVYVTHDQAEALSLSNKIAVMEQGKVRQIGTPREIYERPQTKFVAEFVGISNFLTGELIERTPTACVVSTPLGKIESSCDAGDVAVGHAVTLSIRPELMQVTPADRAGGAVNQWKGTVLTRAYTGEAIDYVLEVDGVRLRARDGATNSIAPDAEVAVSMSPSAVTLVPSA